MGRWHRDGTQEDRMQRWEVHRGDSRPRTLVGFGTAVLNLSEQLPECSLLSRCLLLWKYVHTFPFLCKLTQIQSCLTKLYKTDCYSQGPYTFQFQLNSTVSTAPYCKSTPTLFTFYSKKPKHMRHGQQWFNAEYTVTTSLLFHYASIYLPSHIPKTKQVFCLLILKAETVKLTTACNICSVHWFYNIIT
jgi:hypothetical protein